MQVARQSMIESYGAPAYFDLAQRSNDIARKRELAYQAIILINKGIIASSKNSKRKTTFWEYPSDDQITNQAYWDSVWQKLARSNDESLREDLLTADEQIGEFSGRQAACDFNAVFGKILQLAALILTILSVTLIVLRERHRDA